MLANRNKRAVQVRWMAIMAAALASNTATKAVAQDTEAMVATGLGYAPQQQNVQYDQVDAKDASKCTGKYETLGGIDGLMIYGPDGRLLRRFADTNGDRNVDQWSYYKDGIEVYRDLDTNFNGTADQYRWLGTQGTRWGLDKNEDGQIDSWKTISPEEITIEVVESIKKRDTKRYEKLLLSSTEIDALKLGDKTKTRLLEKIEKTKLAFSEFMGSQRLIDAQATWAQFAADKPGVVPAGTDGSTQDVTAYENVIAILESKGANQQLLVGTIVQIEGGWRLIDAPRMVDSANVGDSGFFFPSMAVNRDVAASPSDNGMTDAMQGMLTELDKVDSAMRDGNATPQQYKERGTILRKLIAASQGTEDMGSWIHQFADSVSSAVQTGVYTEGLEDLKNLEMSLDKLPGGKEHKSYVAFRVISSDFMAQMSDPKANHAAIQETYIEKLKSFALEYSTSPDAAEAMIQIGLNDELGGQETDAQEWYRKVATNFPGTDFGKKASGAIVRLNLEGKTLNLRGKTLEGKDVQTTGPTIVHYWATWCDPCKTDMGELRKLQAKYAKQNLQIVGVNLDNDAATAAKFLKENAGKYPWAHIHEQGGFQSDLATKLGVLSVPVTILIDGKGVVVKRTAGFSANPEMIQALEKLMEGAPAAKPKQANAKPQPNKTNK
ncbi:MAG: redoxin family protein [Planctomycetota bacterium]